MARPDDRQVHDRQVQLNRTRRHFLGMAAATGARTAAIVAGVSTVVLPRSKAQAMGDKWWQKPGSGTTCFLRGTAIRTPKGETPIEDLKIGDLIETVRGTALPVKWIGRRSYRRSTQAWTENVMPVRIAKHALDDQTPHRDLYLSPYHALLIDGALIRVRDLINGFTIAPALPDNRDTIEYFHLVLDTHEVVLAEGAAAETFRIADNNHENFQNFVEFEKLYPEDLHPAMAPYAPTPGYGGGGFAHLKALLRFGMRRIVRRPDPVEDAYDRIAARVPSLFS